MARYTLPFSSIEATLERAGGKGTNLAELARAGFAVPPGFVVTTDAYREFVQANQFSARLLDLARGTSFRTGTQQLLSVAGREAGLDLVPRESRAGTGMWRQPLPTGAALHLGARRQASFRQPCFAGKAYTSTFRG